MQVKIEGNNGGDSLVIGEATPGSEDVPIVIEHCSTETFRGSVPLMVLTALLSDALALNPTELAGMLPFDEQVNRGLANAVTRTEKRQKGGAEDWSDMPRTRE